MMQKPKEPLYFVGIGGSGMQGLAELSHSQGFSVQGSDSQIENYPQKRKLLNDLGIHVNTAQVSSNIREIGTLIYSSAIPKNNPERMAADKMGVASWHRSKLLAYFVNSSQGITVAGTHGKTTTAAITAYLLYEMGCKPKAVIGGVMKNFGSSILSGDGDITLAEADESDGSIVEYQPFSGIITNIEADHLDYYGDFQEIVKVFKTHMESFHEEGQLLVGWDDPTIRTLVEPLKRDCLGYGLVIGADIRATSIKQSKTHLNFNGIFERDSFPISVPLIGLHNVKNVLAALGLIYSKGLNMQIAIEALRNFRGVERRMDILFESPQLTIIDDYAHNPGKIAACLHSLRLAYPYAQIINIFEPHRFSRISTLYSEFCHAFSAANLVVLMPTFSAGESKSKFSIDNHLFAKNIAKTSKVQVNNINDYTKLNEFVNKHRKKETIVIGTGAGNIRKYMHGLIDTMH